MKAARAWFWLVFLALGILMVPSAVSALPVRHDRPVVTNAATVRLQGQDQVFDRLSIGVGDDTRIEAVTGLVNERPSASTSFNRDEIAVQMGRHVIRVCEATAFSPRTFSRDPDFFATCPQARHDYWIPNRERGIVIDVVHQPSDAERLIATQASNIQLRSDNLALEQSLLRSEQRHPIIETRHDPSDQLLIQTLRSDVRYGHAVISKLETERMALAVTLAVLIVVATFVFISLLHTRKNNNRLHIRVLTLQEDVEQTKVRAAAETTALINEERERHNAQLVLAREAVEKAEARAKEIEGICSVNESERTKELHRKLVDAQDQIKSLEAQLVRAKDENVIDELTSLQATHQNTLECLQEVRRQSVADSKLIHDLNVRVQELEAANGHLRERVAKEEVALDSLSPTTLFHTTQRNQDAEERRLFRLIGIEAQRTDALPLRPTPAEYRDLLTFIRRLCACPHCSDNGSLVPDAHQPIVHLYEHARISHPAIADATA